MGTFSHHSGQPQLIVWRLGLDVASTGTAGGVTGNATGARRGRWYAREVSVCYKPYVLV